MLDANGLEDLGGDLVRSRCLIGGEVSQEVPELVGGTDQRVSMVPKRSCQDTGEGRTYILCFLGGGSVQLAQVDAKLIAPLASVRVVIEGVGVFEFVRNFDLPGEVPIFPFGPR